MATIVSPKTRPQMATVRPGVMELKQNIFDNTQIYEFPVQLKTKDIKTKVLEVIKGKQKQTNLRDAKIIVCGGRGIASKEHVKLLDDLAEALGGVVGGTRVAVENGWISKERQIGQTGQSVRPDLFIACGISGAVQHRAGMMNSRIIIAINPDEDAPIFTVADYKIIGDLFEIVPALTKAIEDDFS